MNGRATDEWARAYTLAPGGELQLVGARGRIDVRAGTGPNVEVRAERVVRANRDTTARPLLGQIRISEDVTPERVVLRSEVISGVIIGAEFSVNFRVMVPPATRLRLRTADGAIVVQGVEGALVASTVNGSVSATGGRHGVEVRTVNGGATLELAALGSDPIDVRTTDGSIDLRIPATAAATIEASTVRGAVAIDLPFEPAADNAARRRRGAVNGGGTPVILGTSGGDIRLRSLP